MYLLSFPYFPESLRQQDYGKCDNLHAESSCGETLLLRLFLIRPEIIELSAPKGRDMSAMGAAHLQKTQQIQCPERAGYIIIAFPNWSLGMRRNTRRVLLRRDSAETLISPEGTGYISDGRSTSCAEAIISFPHHLVPAVQQLWNFWLRCI